MVLAVGEHVLGEAAARSMRWATALSGGLGGSRQETCGALSGGAMVIGGLYGRNGAEEDDEIACSLARRYRERFLAEFGTTRCQELYDRFHAPGSVGTCAVVGERAARLLLEVLAEEQEPSDQSTGEGE